MADKVKVAEENNKKTYIKITHFLCTSKILL